MFLLAEAKRYLSPVVGVTEQTLVEIAKREVNRILNGYRLSDKGWLAHGSRVYFLLLRAVIEPEPHLDGAVVNGDIGKRIRELFRDWSMFSGGSGAILGLAHLALDRTVHQTSGLVRASDWTRSYINHGPVKIEFWEGKLDMYGHVNDHWLVVRHATNDRSLRFARHDFTSCMSSVSGEVHPAGKLLRTVETPYSFFAVQSFMNSEFCHKHLPMTTEVACTQAMEMLDGTSWPQMGNHKLNVTAPELGDADADIDGTWFAMAFGPTIDRYLPVLEGAVCGVRAITVFGHRPSLISVNNNRQLLTWDHNFRVGGGIAGEEITVSKVKQIQGSHFAISANAAILSVSVLGFEEG
uniref:Uncharacterized protein n=1 Tax=viral metagenome TaxID=1070528 RepID=A0A2V0RAE1_9ZZZZ